MKLGANVDGAPGTGKAGDEVEFRLEPRRRFCFPSRCIASCRVCWPLPRSPRPPRLPGPT